MRRAATSIERTHGWPTTDGLDDVIRKIGDSDIIGYIPWGRCCKAPMNATAEILPRGGMMLALAVMPNRYYY